MTQEATNTWSWWRKTDTEFATKNHILLTNSNYYKRQQPFICVIPKAVYSVKVKPLFLDAFNQFVYFVKSIHLKKQIEQEKRH